MSEVIVRPVGASDRAQWEPLWRGYLAFYESRVPAEVTETTWRRLVGDDGIHGFLATDSDGHAIGIVHYVYHASTWSLGGNCYLQDLFVAPAARGHGVGQRLIAAVVQAASTRGVAKVYWQTEEFNGPARRVYERMAKRSPFILYEIAIPAGDE